jgi:membrane protein required for colicin V production
VTQFDYLALAVIFVSAVAGWMRGAVREMVTIVSFLLAAFLALFALRYSGPFAREVIHPGWLANVGAVVVVFLVAYMLLRLFGAGLTRHIQNANMLGVLDRSVGLGFGLIRALIILGAFNLLFNATTPPERVPRWISGATLYPMTTKAGQMLTALAPKGLDIADRLKPALINSVRDNAESGRYDAREQNDGSDDLVEKSR